MAEYLTPSELLAANPEIAREWTDKDLGYLLRLNLVKGRKLPRTCLLNVQSVVEAWKFRNGVISLA